ncbi:MAG: class I SAM-dependent methyltransferase [Dehalococcoidia bacterium]|nr:class I SAM-dependent methyltransferase [Dehalococcoidia bacterium]
MGARTVGDPYYQDWAEEYDANSRGVPGDVEFYRDLGKQAGGLVVELGVGTGRIAVPCAEAGVRVHGVDLEPAMLEIARRKAAERGVTERLTLAQGDMRDLGTWGVAGLAALVTIPFRAFLHNLTVEDQVATLEACHGALRPGGVLALNVFNPDLTKIADWLRGGGERWEAWGAPDEGVQAQHEYQPAAQVVTSRLRVRDGQGRWRRTSVTLRYVHRFEMEHLLRRCGYEVDALYGDFDRSAFGEASPEMVWVAHRV